MTAASGSMATSRVLMRFVARAVFDETTWSVRQDFDPPILSKDELIDLLRQEALKPEEEIARLVTEGILKALRGGKDGYTLNLKKRGLFHFLYKFLFSDRAFMQQTADEYHFRSTIIAEFYTYMASLEGQGIDTGNFLDRYPLEQVKDTTSQAYNSYNKAIVEALNKMVLFSLLEEKNEGSMVKYIINHDFLSKHAPEELIEHQTHVTLSDLGIYSSHATELSLHNIYMLIKHPGIDWKGLLLGEFPPLVKTFFHMKINIDIEAEIKGALDRMREPAFVKKLIDKGIILPDECSKGNKGGYIIIGNDGWYFDPSKKRIFHSYEFGKGGGEMTIYVYRGLHQGLAGVPSLHVQINQELKPENKEAITYFRFLSLMDWFDDTFLKLNARYFNGIRANDFNMTNVEYNIDILASDSTMERIHVNEQSKELKVQAFKIMLRIYDMTSILRAAMDSGQVSAFSSLGDITRYIDAGLRNFIRFEERSTEPASVRQIKEFLKQRADYVLSGNTHQTIISGMLHVENLAFHVREHARVIKRNSDTLYAIRMDQAWIKIAARNMAASLEELDDKVTDGFNTLGTAFESSKAGIETKIEEYKAKVDESSGEQLTKLQKFELDQFDDIGTELAGFKTSMDGFEGELVQESMIVKDVKTQNETVLTQQQAMLVELESVKNIEDGIKQILEQHETHEEERLELERNRLQAEKEQQKRQEKIETARAIEAERKERESRLNGMIDQFINSCQVKWGFNISFKISSIMHGIDVKELGKESIIMGQALILDAEKACLDNLRKVSRFSKQYWFDDVKAENQVKFIKNKKR